jgi:hypothetical protein
MIRKLAALASVLLAAACFFARPAEAAIGFHVGSNATCSNVGTAHTCVFPTTLTSGDWGWACVVSSGGSDISSSASDSSNGSWTPTAAGQVTTLNGRKGRCFYKENMAASAPTFSWSTASSVTSWVVMGAYSGVLAASSIVAQDSAQQSINPGDDFACPALSATAAGQYNVGGVFSEFNANDLSPNNGETERQEQSGGGGLQFEDKAVAGAGSVRLHWTVDVADNLECNHVVIAPILASAPSFSANPAIGTRTTSSIPITATGGTCADCTFYGVVYADGLATPNCTQVKAAQDSTGAAAYKAFNVAMSASTPATGTFSSYTDGTKRDSAYCMHSTAGGDSAVFALGDIDKLPISSCSFDSSSVNGGLKYNCTLDGAGTIYLVACIKDSANATVTQVETAKCTGGVTAEAAVNRSGTGAVTLGTVLPFPIYDVSYVGVYNFGSQHEAATHQDFDRFQTPPTGFQYVTLASVTATGSLPKAYNDAAFITVTYDTQTVNFRVGDLVWDKDSGAWGIILVDGDGGATGQLTVFKKSGTFNDNDRLTDMNGAAALVNGATAAITKIAIGDILQVQNHISPAGDAAVCPGALQCLTMDTSGQVTYSATGRQTSPNTLIYHVATGAFLVVDLDAIFNNTAPACGAPRVLALKLNVPMATFPLTTACGDPDLETVHYAIPHVLPPGLVLDWTTGDITGTPTVENKAGLIEDAIVYDAADDYGTLSLTIYPVDHWNMTNCTTGPLSESACRNQIDSDTVRSLSVSSRYVCSAVTFGSVISQVPVAGAAVAPQDSVTLTVSVGRFPCAGVLIEQGEL